MSKNKLFCFLTFVLLALMSSTGVLSSTYGAFCTINEIPDTPQQFSFTLSGTTLGANKYIQMHINDQNGDIVYIDNTTVNVDGSYSNTIFVPPSWEAGQYTVVVGFDNNYGSSVSNQTTLTILDASPVLNTMNEIINSTPSALTQIISNNKETVLNMGIDVNVYLELLNETGKDYMNNILAKLPFFDDAMNLTENVALLTDSFKSNLPYALFITSTDASNILAGIELYTKDFFNCEPLPHTVNNYFATFLLHNRITANDGASFTKAHKDVQVYYDVNNISFVNLTNIIKGNSVLLGVSDLASYAKYFSYSTEQQQEVNKKIVLSLSSNPVYTEQKFSTVFDSAVTTTTFNSGGTGGSVSVKRPAATSGGSSFSVSSGSASGESVSGESDSGESASGESASGESDSGESASGESDSGESDFGESAAGESNSGELDGKTKAPPHAIIVFDDLVSVPWAEEAISKLTADGVFNGYGDNKFLPNNNVTREEFAKIIVLAYGITLPNPETISVYEFTDVDSLAWYSPYIKALHDSNITKGTSDGVFGVGQFVMREQAVTMIKRVLDYKKIQLPEKIDAIKFSDDDKISSYARDSIYYLAKADVINGAGNLVFDPQGFLTRAEAAKVIFNAGGR